MERWETYVNAPQKRVGIVESLFCGGGGGSKD